MVIKLGGFLPLFPQGAEETARRNTTAKDVHLTHAAQQPFKISTDGTVILFIDNYIALLYITTYTLTMKRSYELKMNLYFDPIQRVVVRNRRNRVKKHTI